MATMVLLYFIVKVKQKQKAVIGLASLKSFFKICLPKNGFVSDSKRFAVSRTSRLRCSLKFHTIHQKTFQSRFSIK